MQKYPNVVNLEKVMPDNASSLASIGVDTAEILPDVNDADTTSRGAAHVREVRGDAGAGVPGRAPSQPPLSRRRRPREFCATSYRTERSLQPRWGTSKKLQMKH